MVLHLPQIIPNNNCTYIIYNITHGATSLRNSTLGSDNSTFGVASFN